MYFIVSYFQREKNNSLSFIIFLKCIFFAVKSKKENILTKNLVGLLSEKLQDHWQALAPPLGFQDDEIEYYADSFSKKEGAEQMLTVWMERDGFIPTFIQTVEKTNLPSSIVAIIKGLVQQD